jgi:hypothetical protein
LFVVYADAEAFGSRYPLVEELVKDGYRTMADVPIEGVGAVPILVDRTRVPTATDSDTGWPCFIPTD